MEKKVTNMVGVRAAAKKLNVSIYNGKKRLKRAPLIRSIQLAEGNNDCFAGTVGVFSCSNNCKWSSICCNYEEL